MELHADHSFAQKSQISAIWQPFRDCYLAWSDVAELWPKPSDFVFKQDIFQNYALKRLLVIAVRNIINDKTYLLH